jgi:hypothetical protein
MPAKHKVNTFVFDGAETEDGWYVHHGACTEAWGAPIRVSPVTVETIDEGVIVPSCVMCYRSLESKGEVK